MHSCFDVARYFLSLVDEEAGDSLSNLKLQKLVYYAQGFHLALHDEPLFRERIEAWAHGPVVPDLYHALKKFGAAAVTFDGEFNTDTFSATEKELLNEIYSVFGQFSASRLRNITHQEPPWIETPSGHEIPLDLMRTYFKTQISK
jgi:uncharacterized phage-associated protein